MSRLIKRDIPLREVICVGRHWTTDGTTMWRWIPGVGREITYYRREIVDRELPHQMVPRWWRQRWTFEEERQYQAQKKTGPATPDRAERRG